MKTAIRFDLLVVLSLFLSSAVSAQIDFRPCPQNLLDMEALSFELPALDVEAAWKRANREASQLGKHLYGVVQEGAMDLSPAEGEDVHVAAVRVQGASGVALHFDQFHLPVGAELWVTAVSGGLTRAAAS